MVFLPSLTAYQIQIFDSADGTIASSLAQTGQSGLGTDLTKNLVFGPSTSRDQDGDGLPDDIEQAIGTDVNKVDTDYIATDDLPGNPSGLRTQCAAVCHRRRA